MVTQPGSRSAATTLPRSSGSATPTESSPAGGCPQLTAQQCTQTPQSGVERPDPPICVHSCDPKATHSPSPQFNSVHKRPKLAQRAPILSSVYTIAATRGRPRHNSVHKRSKSVPGGSYRPFVYTIAATRGRPQHNSVHKRPNQARRGPILPSVYTIATPRGHPQPNSVYKCTQGTAEKPSRVRYVASPQLPLEERRDLVERDGVLPAPVVEVGVHRARNDHQLLVLGVVASPRHVGKRVLAEVP